MTIVQTATPSRAPRHIRWLAVPSVLLALLLMATAVTPAHAAGTRQDSERAAVVTLTNKYRTGQGQKALTSDTRLNEIAQEWANEMSRTGYRHSPSGWLPGRLPEGWMSAGENIAMGYRSSDAVVAGWIGSEGHRLNMVRPSFTRIGAGYVESANLWVQIFAGYPNDTSGQLLTTTPTPKITGTLTTGSQLTATTGIWKPSPVALGYQWKRNGKAIPGATSSRYTLATADISTNITVTVTGKKSGYTSIVTTSPSVAIPATLSVTPIPKITGTVKVGSKLTAVPGTWLPKPVTLKYQWKRGGAAISRATTSTYTPVTADAGQKITVTVTGTQSRFQPAAKTSAAVTVPKSLTATPVPKISGTTTVGKTLTAAAGSWSPAPVTLKY